MIRRVLAKDIDRIVGMVAFRDYSHISMLFVDKNYQTIEISISQTNQIATAVCMLI